MSKKLLNLRIEKDKLERIKKIAQYNGLSCSSLIRDKIDELLSIRVNTRAEREVKKIINELRQPFLYVKSDMGTRYAKNERSKREFIAKRLEVIFNLV